VTFVLVPGAGGDSWYWHRVAPELRDRGHDVVTPDLPAADDAAGLREYAGAVLEAIGGCERVVLVAQSMAAFSAAMACGRAHVALLVLVAPMIPRLAADRLGVGVDVIDSGHLPALSRPRELARRLEGYASELGGSPA
jgi:pimeloyl-ACP methyl ester carboxylesterase